MKIKSFTNVKTYVSAVVSLSQFARTGKFSTQNRVTNDIINNKRKIDIEYLFIIQIYDCSSIFFIVSISFRSWLLHTSTLTITGGMWHFLTFLALFRFSSLSLSISFSKCSLCRLIRVYMMLFVVELQANQHNSSVFCLLISGRLLHETWSKLT